MDHDLTIMIYGAIMGVVGSILTSIVTTIFQFWLERREQERRHNEERSRQLRHIHLPTDEEIIIINSSRDQEITPEGQRKAAEAGSIALSLFVGGFMVYQTHDLMLGFAFTFMLGFLLTNRVIRALKR
jgi:predicted PurR-regulated permease PerM